VRRRLAWSGGVRLRWRGPRGSNQERERNGGQDFDHRDPVQLTTGGLWNATAGWHNITLFPPIQISISGIQIGMPSDWMDDTIPRIQSLYLRQINLKLASWAGK
jgi:hypothetical protein